MSRPWALVQNSHFYLNGMMLDSVSRRKVVLTDASKTGWGTLCNGKIAFGSWATSMMTWQINHLAIMAVILAFKEFMTELRDDLNNRIVVVFINHQGGTLLTDRRTDYSYRHRRTSAQ